MAHNAKQVPRTLSSGKIEELLKIKERQTAKLWWKTATILLQSIKPHHCISNLTEKTAEEDGKPFSLTHDTDQTVSA